MRSAECVKPNKHKGACKTKFNSCGGRSAEEVKNMSLAANVAAWELAKLQLQSSDNESEPNSSAVAGPSSSAALGSTALGALDVLLDI